MSKSWAEEYFADWSGTDVEKVVEWFTDDVVYEDVTMKHVATGKAGVRGIVAFSFKKAPATYEVVGFESLGDSYAAEWVMQPQGVRGASIGKLRDGKIYENRDYWNGAEFQPE